jgi:hypothetical protein
LKGEDGSRQARERPDGHERHGQLLAEGGGAGKEQARQSAGGDEEEGWQDQVKN